LSERLPILGLTMGDPAGIGAEVIVKALADPEIRKLANFVIYGLNEILTYAADRAEIETFWWRDQYDRFNLPYQKPVVALDYDDIADPLCEWRGPSKLGGQASMQFLLDAIKHAQGRKIDAIVTAPICKESWKLAGYSRYPGHTELLADKTKAKRYAMMFAGLPRDQRGTYCIQAPGGRGAFGLQYAGLRVVLATIHEPLFEIRNKFTIGCVFDPIDLAHQALHDWMGIERPRIAVCGLNPHAGENGQFGDEEKRIIEPAIQMARNIGIDVHGPFAADTIFLKAAQGAYDCVVAMYHDQGLIPVKLLDFHGSVNMTLGLPIVRTSVDHGTAFDIARKNRADPSSMKAAIVMAAHIAKMRMNATPSV
jgi:4-hydroxythreonine-4-phosphate dehydrogenase